jgi:hypothetical protein
MSDDPIHNSGAELEGRPAEELRAELRGSFPGGKRWEGITYELSRRASERQEKMIRWTLYAALAAVLVGLLGIAVSVL